METTRLSGGTQEDRAKTFATLLSAFRADPVERWLYPDERDYDQFFPAFLAAFGGEAFAHDTVWRLDDFSAVALWLSAGVEPDADEIVRVLMTTVDEARHEDTMAALEQMDAAHPRYPHWYLPWFGVEARAQGSGLGGTLMLDCLRAVDESGLPAHHFVLRATWVPRYRIYPHPGLSSDHIHAEGPQGWPALTKSSGCRRARSE
jgi:GNAT superfamily N-acetyltransferase